MLYNPDAYRPPVKADPLALESLIAWLETKPADNEYPYFAIRGCLICQYLDFAGIAYHSAGAEDFALPHPFPGRKHLSWGNVASAEPHTFGAALSRARKALQA